MAQRRRPQTGGGGTPPSAGGRTGQKPGWRTTIDSWGGFSVIGVILAAVIGLGALVWVSLPDSVSDDPLRGETIPIGQASHVGSLEQMEIVAGRPPVGGPHFPRWQETGVYEERVADGLAVHALEHGVIWISYNPGLVDEADLEALRAIADDYRADVILSPRPENSMPIAVASWGQLLTLEEADRDEIRRFIETNRNRSPEPGVR